MQPRDRPLTANQRAYLAAFDAHLRAGTLTEKLATRSRMSQLLGGMLEEAGVDRGATSHERGPRRERFRRIRRRLARAA